MAKLLLVEDDELVAEALKSQLQKRGHQVEWVTDGSEGLSRLKNYNYDAAILDWQLPNKDGTQILKEYRAAGGNVPVLMLTSFREKSHKLEGFDAGADDYVTKPFDTDEVCARIQALLRRPVQLFPDAVQIGNLRVDVAKKVVSRGGIPIKLLPKEFALLEFLLRRADQFFDVEALLNHVWSSESDATEAAVWQVVKRLRAKLDEPDTESIIVNVKGMGYKIDKSRIANE